jgi:Na+/serine symporter
MSSNEYKYKFEAFKADIFDYFNCIIKTIEDEKIQTLVDYKQLLNKLNKDFKLVTIVEFINSLINEANIRKNENIYKLVIEYSNEIMATELMKQTFENITQKYKID